MAKENEFRQKLLEWFERNGRNFPWRKTTDPYKIFLAEFMLQKTKANQAAAVYGRFIEKYPTFCSLAKSKPTDVKKIMKPLGLAYRAHRLRKVAIEVTQKFGNRLPSSKEELVKLHGVGDYISNAVISFAFDRPVPVVDRNVLRIIGRVFSLTGEKEIRCFLEKLLPKETHKEFNWALLDLGGTVCQKNKPKCAVCPLATICNYNLSLQKAARQTTKRKTGLNLAV